MGWTIDYFPPNEPILLNNYLLAVGKSLYIATGFESKCRFVLQIITLVSAIEDGESFDSATELVKAMDERLKMLGTVIFNICSRSNVNISDLDVLRAAKDARNYIAHESAAIGSLSIVRAEVIEKQFAQLLSQVEILAIGDNLLSKWCYEICEKEPAPSQIQKDYVRMVIEWIGDLE